MAGKRKAAAPKGSAYDQISARILAELEKGKVPWQQPWVGGQAPCNLDGKPYRGINALLLAIAGFGSRHWGTYHAINEHGGRVRRGQRGEQIWVWRPESPEDVQRRLDRQAEHPTPDAEKPRWIVVSHVVFNAEQCDGLSVKEPEPLPIRTISPIERAEAIIAAMPNCPRINELGTRAYWRPQTDEITLPPRLRFRSDAAYYSTEFHELTHSTAHPSRVGRDIDGHSFNLHTRSEEELVAEIGASFLCAEAGFESPEDDINSAAYIADWMSQIKADKMLVTRAAKAAQKAVDYIVCRHARPLLETISLDNQAGVPELVQAA